MIEYWDEKIETMPPDKIRELQLKLFNRQLERMQKTSAYRGKLPQKIKSLDEIKNLPFVCKDDLRRNYPYGFLAIPKEDIARFNATSGTTGDPLVVYFSETDISNISQRSARNHYMAGMRKKDIIQVIPSSNLFVGGWYNNSGIFNIGATLLPTGPIGTEKQIYFFKLLKTTFCLSTGGYFSYLVSKISDADIRKLSLKSVILGAEPLSQNAKNLIKNKLKIKIFDIYGFSEVGGPFAQDCEFHNGLHIPEDQFYCEIVDPNTGALVPDGEYGELVVTPLQQEAMPLIRYRTRDITRFLNGKCLCGRTHRRIEAITHRIDDMIIINGVNVFPSQIEECIYKHLTNTTNYLVHIKEKDGLKKLAIDIELPYEQLKNLDKLKNLEYKLIQTLKSCITVTPRLNFMPIGTLPEIQGKAKRIIKDDE